jgi:prepilin-type processing-associated H-X9-DG protein
MGETMSERDKKALLGLLTVVLFAVAAFLFSNIFYGIGSRVSAKQGACLSNLKRMALALRMYAEDNDDLLPFGGGWMDGCLPYLRHPDMTLCPNVPYRYDHQKRHGYAFNSDLARKALPAIKDPARQILLFDSTNLAKNAADPLTSLPTEPRHTDGNAVVYVDGHAKVLQAGDRR